jgi:hypothetical protein
VRLPVKLHVFEPGLVPMPVRLELHFLVENAVCALTGSVVVAGPGSPGRRPLPRPRPQELRHAAPAWGAHHAHYPRRAHALQRHAPRLRRRWARRTPSKLCPNAWRRVSECLAESDQMLGGECPNAWRRVTECLAESVRMLGGE